MVNISPEAFDIRLIIDQISICLKQLQDAGKTLLIEELKKAAAKYPNTDFSKLMHRLQDAEII